MEEDSVVCAVRSHGKESPFLGSGQGGRELWNLSAANPDWGHTMGKPCFTVCLWTWEETHLEHVTFTHTKQRDLNPQSLWWWDNSATHCATMQPRLKRNRKWTFTPPWQIIYDEGPLYIFAKTEDIRRQWIRVLKQGQWSQMDGDGFALAWAWQKEAQPFLCSNAPTFSHACLTQEVKYNKDLLPKYHPCFWVDGVWLCCHQEVKQAMGCKVLETRNTGQCFSDLLQRLTLHPYPAPFHLSVFVYIDICFY